MSTWPERTRAVTPEESAAIHAWVAYDRLPSLGDLLAEMRKPSVPAPCPLPKPPSMIPESFLTHMEAEEAARGEHFRKTYGLWLEPNDD